MRTINGLEFNMIYLLRNENPEYYPIIFSFDLLLHVYRLLINLDIDEDPTKVITEHIQRREKSMLNGESSK